MGYKTLSITENMFSMEMKLSSILRIGIIEWSHSKKVEFTIRDKSNNHYCYKLKNRTKTMLVSICMDNINIKKYRVIEQAYNLMEILALFKKYNIDYTFHSFLGVL